MIGATAVSAAQNSLQKIDAAVANGALSAELGVIFKGISVTNPASLPAEYKSNELMFDKCATDLVTAALALIEENKETYGAYRETLLARPIKAFYIDSPSGHFRLHFDTVGVHAIPTADADSNGVPDFLEVAMMAADSSWSHYINSLGYYEPVSDLTLGGGVDIYDLYFETIPYYGLTTPETAGPADWNDYSSYIKIHSRFTPGFPPNDDPDGDVYGALKVTIAHEFHHAIQFAYDAFEESYFMEETATSMEEVVFPVVNDNHNYLLYYYDEPEVGLQQGGVHRYASFIWPLYLREKYDDDLVRSMWSSCRYNNAISAWSTNLVQRGTTLDKAFSDFTMWNYFTGDRADTTHFPEAAVFPQPVIMSYHQELPDSGNTSSLPPEPLGSNYIVFENFAGYHGILSFEMVGLSAATWALSYVIDYGNGNYEERTAYSVPNGKVRVSIDSVENVLRVIYIPAVGSHFGTEFNYVYHLSFRKQGDLDNDDQVAIGDAVYAINYIFGGGPAPQPLRVMDCDCSGTNTIADAVYIINYIFGGGPPPCVISGL